MLTTPFAHAKNTYTSIMQAKDITSVDDRDIRYENSNLIDFMLG